VKIEIAIPSRRVADLMTTAMESGDPVTTAARGGWCHSITKRRRTRKAHSSPWYADPRYFEGPFAFDVVEYHEENDTVTYHRINAPRVRDGLHLMAMKFPFQFAQILTDEIDAPCADIFLQCVVFGDEKYA